MRLLMGLWIIGLSLAITPALAQNKAKPAYEMNAEGEIHVATDGRVTDYQLRSELPPAISTLLDRAVRAWRFEPVLVDGVAVNAKTAMHLGLTAEPQSDDKYVLRVANVRFGEPQLRKSSVRPPHYPESAVHAHVGARVLLSLHLDEKGKVVEVAPYQTSLDVRMSSENQAEHWRKEFEQASVRAARNWQYDLTETLDGKPIGTHVLVPLSFYLCEVSCRSSDSEGKWKAYLPGPVHPAPWSGTARVADAEDASLLKDGQALAVDSPFQLRENVIGKTL